MSLADQFVTTSLIDITYTLELNLNGKIIASITSANWCTNLSDVYYLDSGDNISISVYGATMSLGNSYIYLMKISD